MAYFPMFVELEGRRVLIVGGGRVALRKAEKLMPYGAEITVAAPEICNELATMQGVRTIAESFSEEMLHNADVIIAATDDRELNKRISELCREEKIPVNTVDDSELCSFIFPCLIKKGSLSIGISTGGASPTAAISFKNKINELIPHNTEAILDYLNALRSPVKERFPEEKTRSRIFKELFELCINSGGPLTEAETEEFLKNVR
ncbi:MAG: bifunctional precorrin-2 dehydrogenase/sirohydrochlorin ferrochelatase [Bacillota bacterium]|nr:bifunctional precorrin-2 dehydrogenase/sirohydrochlorin ferrochelatase [Bacillota bacterium]